EYRDLNAVFKDFSKDSSNDVSAASPIFPTAGQNYSNNTNPISATGPIVPAAEYNYSNSTNPISAAGPSNSNSSLTHGQSSLKDTYQPHDMVEREDIVYSDNENVGAEADFNNLETSITEEVYVCKPLGFEDPDHLDKVYKVVKALYGLHQAPRAWYETLANYLVKNRQVLDEFNGGTHILSGSSGKSARTPIDTEKPLLKDPDGEDVDGNDEEQGDVEEQGNEEEQGNADITTEEPKTAVPEDAANDQPIPSPTTLNPPPQQPQDTDIYHIDMDHAAKVLSMQEDESEVQEAVEVVTTAKLITEVVAAISETVSVAPVIPSAVPETISAVAAIPTVTAPPVKVAALVKAADKGKGILVEEPKHMKKKQQVELDEAYARKLQEEFNQDIDWEAAMDHVKEKAKEEPFIQRYQTPAQKAAKRRKLIEEVKEAESIKQHLQIVPDKDDDVFTEATPLARKVPVVDYQIILLVERRYPLTKFTLEQMLNVVRLQVEEKSEMSLELIRLTRQQL
nr:reverse transcriptase [Tanacetum cinerariifolium]